MDLNRAVLLAIAATCAATAVLAAVFSVVSPGRTPTLVARVPSSALAPSAEPCAPPALLLADRHTLLEAPADSGRTDTTRSAVIQPVCALRGRLEGAAPGYGEAWVVEAYRLTSSRSAVVEHRQVYVEPDGSLTLPGLGPGLWQTALVAPRFAWGPLVDTAVSSPPAPLILGVGETGRLHVDTVANAAVPRGTPLRVSLTAVRSPALAGAAVRVQRLLTARELEMGAAWTLDEVAAGTYEVCATVTAARPPRGRSAAVRAHVVVQRGTARVELGFGGAAAQPVHAQTPRIR